MDSETTAIQLRPNELVSFGPNRGLMGHAAEPRGGATDLSSIYSAFLRNRWLVLIILSAALVAGLAHLALAKRVYHAEATIEIAPEEAPIVSGDQQQVKVANAEADRALQTQLDILKSRSTAASVVDRLGLTKNPVFLAEAGIDPNLSEPLRKARATYAIQQGLSVSQPLTTRIIKLGYDSPRPDFAATVANGYAEAFIADSFQRKSDSYSYARTFLQQQLASAKSRLEASENALLSYARSTGLVDASGAAGMQGDDGQPRSLTKANLVDLNAAYAQARAARIQAQQRWSQANATPVMSLPEVLSNPSIQTLSQSRAELEATYQEERQHRKPDHPAVQQAQAKIREMDRQIATIAGSIRQSIGDQYRVAARQENALLGSVGQLKSATFSEEGKGIRHNILKREVDSNRNLYNTLLQRFHEVGTQAADTKNRISLVDRAQPPALPSSPRPVISLALAAVAGLMAALLTILWKARSDSRLHSPAEIPRALNVPLLGVVPRIRKQAEFVHALADSRSILTEAHYSICVNLEPLTDIGAHGVVLLTSCAPNEGKSTTAVQIATVLAEAGRRVLLIDADMRRGSLHRVLGCRNDDVGLAELLTAEDHGEASRAIQFCEERNFAFLASGSARNSPAALLSGPTFPLLLREYAATYDTVIIDGPPVIGLADTPRMASLADATLLVLEAGHVPRERCKTALDRLIAAGASQIGVVMTKYDPALDKATDAYAYNYDYSAVVPPTMRARVFPWLRHTNYESSSPAGARTEPDGDSVLA